MSDDQKKSSSSGGSKRVPSPMQVPPPRKPTLEHTNSALFSENVDGLIRRVLSDPELYKEEIMELTEEEEKRELEEGKTPPPAAAAAAAAQAAREDDEAAARVRDALLHASGQDPVLALVAPHEDGGGSSMAVRKGRRVPRVAAEQQRKLLWALLAAYLPTDVTSLQQYFVRHLEYSLCASKTPSKATKFTALALSVRDHLVERWKDTQMYFHAKDVKRVYYMSMEYLVGRSLQNAVIALGLEGSYARALHGLGVSMEELYEEEYDAGLGNGGLGRLASCFMDSISTLDYGGFGYGLRYTYGIFRQVIKNGEQHEEPDYWLNRGNPWEIERPDVVYSVGFYGTLAEFKVTDGGETRFHWQPAQVVEAVAYDTPIPGYDTYNCLSMRLWSSRPPKEFDLASFSRGDYYKAVEEKQQCENITHVLYPNDQTPSGKELRLKQQYFFVSASLQDILRRFKRSEKSIDELPSMAAIQLNDTHPSLGVPELMRLLMDQEGLPWERAWSITTRVFSYTNHTVLPEALEVWSVDMLEAMLPRQMRIIFDINMAFLRDVERRWPGDIDRLRRMSIIEEGATRKVRMAHLAIVGSHAVNGVAAIHTEIVKSRVFPDFHAMWPNKFQNKTNGVTPRRWLGQANPGLAALITKWLKTDDWMTDLTLLRGLETFIDNTELHKQWAAVKLENKRRLARLAAKWGVDGVNAETMLFDVHVKRFHEYKRQLLNILSVIYRYRRLKEMNAEARAAELPRAVFFGGKAAPGYYMAKLIIKLVCAVADVVNADPDVHSVLKVVMVPNYCVSLAELIVPASDVSQHISTAGTEASGTSNMKFALNGGAIIGTLDGANIEIREEIGDENMFVFGALADEVEPLRAKMRAGALDVDPRFRMVLGMLQIGRFGDVSQFQPLLDSLAPTSDFYLLGYDFGSYLAAQERVDAAYRDRDQWVRLSIRSTARMAKFSSDRTIREYAEQIWGLEPCRRAGPMAVDLSRLKETLKDSATTLPMPHNIDQPVHISAERFGAI